nr:PREDICTED: zinc finger protein 761-like [Linepithema humile]
MCFMRSIPYQCDTCGKTYKWKESLSLHKRMECVCGNLRKWVCFQCGKRYLWRGSLKNHIRVECGKEPAFKCPVCGRKFKHKHRWQSHANSKTEDCILASMLLTQENNELSWSQQRPFDQSTYKMLRNARKKDSSDAKYECTRCGKTYKAATSLSRHKRLECGVIPCEICPICGRRFKHRFVLNAHIVACERRMSQTDNAFMNELGGLEFKVNDMNVVNSSRRFPSRSQVPQELQRYMCGECGKAYKWMDNLRRHQRLECGKLPKWHCKIYHTELCDWLTDPLVTQELNENISQSCFEFVTTDYNELSQESLEHREKKYKITTLVCDECGKNFSRLDSLKRHEKLYCKNKRRCCPHCDENGQCAAEKSNDDKPEVCEVPFHGQLNYLLCDSPILNSVEASVVQKNAKCQQFRCDGCGRAYTRLDSLKRHQQKCDEYLASFQDQQEALERLQQQEYYCNQCGKSYRRLDTLRRHQRLVCVKDQPEEYDALWVLERKARSIGQETQEILPSKSYASSKMNDYSQVYGGDSYMLQTEYICTDCGKKYKWLDSLRRHQRVDCGNKEKKFSCHMCDRKFKYRYELRNHIAGHHRYTML